MKADKRGDILVASVNDVAGLERLEPEWRALATACSAATVFQTYEWNAAWWRHFGRMPGRRLHIVTFRAKVGGELIGLAPLMTSYWYATPLRRLSFAGTGTSDYHDIIALPGQEDAVADAFYRYLKALGGWHICDLRQLRAGGLLRHRMPPSDAGLTVRDAPLEACPYLGLSGDWPTVLAGFGKKTRSNIGYHDRALRKMYEVSIGAAATEAELRDEMTQLFELHQRRWNQRWLPGVFSGRRVQAFHRDVALQLLNQNWLKLFYLRLDGETQASLYCFSYGDRIRYYQGGFEPTLAKLSLGTVLTARAIQTAVEEGKTVFDFLRGDEPYKAKWTSASETNILRLMTKRGAGLSLLARAAYRLESAVERRAKAWARTRR